MAPEEQMRMAERARTILDDELVKNALAQLESVVVDQWKDLSVENKAQAEELKRLLWAAQQFKSVFTVLIANGAVAKNELLLRSNVQIKEEAAMRRIYA